MKLVYRRTLFDLQTKHMIHTQSEQCLAVEEKPSPRIILGTFHDGKKILDISWFL